MMKFPSAFAGGTAPAGNSVAATNPGAWGSRVGGNERPIHPGFGCEEFVGCADDEVTPMIKATSATNRATS